MRSPYRVLVFSLHCNRLHPRGFHKASNFLVWTGLIRYIGADSMTGRIVPHCFCVWIGLPRMKKIRALLVVGYCLFCAPVFAGIASTHSITVRWTAPGDDKSAGRAYRYDLRFSTSPITASNWNQASPASPLPLPTQPGNLQTCTVNNLVPSTTYYFRMKTADEKYNWSGLSNQFSLATCGGTCTGITGNTDCSPESPSVVDISDLVTLIAYLYVNEEPMCMCLAEANVDGDSLGDVDIGDITALIGYLYLGQIQPSPCQ